MSDKLAIIIPAYKKKYLEQALQSVANQTNKNFTLYIGDDNSPENLYEVIEKYKGDINIVYQRFEKNSGKNFLVKQWARCIDMAKDENWIWLFSDDDVMSENCVDEFYKTVNETNGGFNVYRFQCQLIDKNNTVLYPPKEHPQIESSYNFLMRRLSYSVYGSVVDKIFSKEIYQQKGLADFSAGWNSDDASWVLFSEPQGMYLIKHGMVSWRASDINISGNTVDSSNRKLKLKGSEQFAFWVIDWLQKNKTEVDYRLLESWFFTMLHIIGYKNMPLIYLQSNVFRKIFWKKNLFYQVTMLSNFILSKAKIFFVNAIYAFPFLGGLVKSGVRKIKNKRE